MRKILHKNTNRVNLISKEIIIRNYNTKFTEVHMLPMMKENTNRVQIDNDVADDEERRRQGIERQRYRSAQKFSPNFAAKI